MSRLVPSCLLLAAILWPGSVRAQIPNPFELAEHALTPHPLSARSVGFRIDADLNTDTHVLTGTVDIYLLNTSDNPLTEIPLHLYMNAFSSNRTRMGKRISRLRRMLRAPINADTVGYCRIVELSANFNDLTSHIAWDETVATVSLPFQVLPGESVLLHVKFQTKLPKLVVRSGYADTFHFLGQWFPKPGVLQPDGSWVCHPYGSNGEFFSEFGVYDVTLTVPDGYRVAATGKQLSVMPENGRTRYHFYAEDVHDFAAAVWDRFLSRSHQEGDVALTVWYPPGHEQLATRQLDALVRTYRWYVSHIGPYPYPVYHLVDVPFHALAAAGMEYPMLGTGFALKLFPRWYRLPEETVVHEFGHSYFQGMLASNEFDEAWLDEGINTYMTGIIMESLYGPCSFTALERLCADSFDRLMGADHAWLRFVKPDMPADAFPDRDAYSDAAYTKVALLLRTLSNQVGQDTLLDVIRQYVRQYAFHHPTGDDFVRLLNRQTENRYAGLINRVIHQTAFPDAAVIDVSSEALPAFRGYSMTEDRYLEEPAGKPGQLHRIVLGKHDLPLPVPYRIFLSNGRIIRGELGITDTVRTVEIPALPGTRVRLVELDPERTIALDLDRSNNRWGRPVSETPRLASPLALIILLEMISHVF